MASATQREQGKAVLTELKQALLMYGVGEEKLTNQVAVMREATEHIHTLNQMVTYVLLQQLIDQEQPVQIDETKSYLDTLYPTPPGSHHITVSQEWETLLSWDSL